MSRTVLLSQTQAVCGCTILAVGLCLLQGCISFGKEFPTDVSWIKVKQTTQSEVSKRLGVPQEMGLVSQVKFWSYYHYRFSLFEEHRRRDLKIYWNPDFTVHSFSLSTSPKDFSASPPAKTTTPKPSSPSAKKQNN